MTFPYGWCAYCPNFTYHDLDFGSDGKQPGACGDCLWRWRKYPQTRPTGRKMIDAVIAGLEPGPCHICGGEADGECVICGRPVCDDDARMKDHDRFCTGCAPPPAG